MIIEGEEQYVITIIMAAGKGTRMKSKKSKLVHKIYGKELIKRVADLAKAVGSDEIVTVVGHLKEEIENVLGDTVQYAYQDDLLGTGHALMQATPFLENKKGKVIILYGDVPIRRIIRDEGGNIKAIVEEKDANMFEKEIKEINSGIYCFDIEELLSAIKLIKPDNAQGEYYLTDVIKIMNDKGLKTGAVIVEDNTEILGVNDRAQLELLTRVLRMRINAEHMRNGVTIEDSNSTYIYDNVIIGMDTVIHPNTTIHNGVIIGENCEIGPNAHIRPNCIVGNNVKIGNNVEIKNTKIGNRSKVPHFIYLGDCEVGEDCNIGCGVITCNYDGKEKYKTIIGNRAFIGSNVNFVAPVKIGEDTIIAAGSTITDDVPDGHLSIARQRQINKIRK